MENPRNIIHMAINQLSDELGLADSTVFRFCQKIGFSGFQAFKIALAAEVVNPIQDIHERIEVGDSIKTVTEKVLRSNMKALEDTLSIFSPDSMEKAVDLICHAHTIGLFGNGGSGIVALDGYHKLLRIGLNTFANLDSHMQIMSAAQLGPKDAAVLISHSGSTKDILDVLHILKDRKVPIIGVTNFAKSPLSKEADVTLYTVSEETDFRSEALSSRIAQLSLIDALYTNVMIKKGNKGKAALDRMRKAISLKRL